MTDPAIPDDARDALALIRTYLDDDDQAGGIIHANCDPHGVLAIMTAIAAQELISTKGGENGVRRWLDRIRHRISQEDTP